MECPDINSVVLCGRDHDTVIKWIENRINNWVCMPNEGLEEVGSACLRIIVPHLNKVVFTSCQHEATIYGKVCACDGSFVYCAKLS